MLNHWTVRACLLAGISVVATGAFAGSVAAQDCALYCYPCLGVYHEGKFGNESGHYDAACSASGECGTDGCGPQLVGDAGPAAELILASLDVTDAGRVSQVVAEYGGRLLLDAESRLVVVRGTACDPDQLAAVQFVSEDILRALAEAGVGTFGDFLAAEEHAWR